MRAIKEELGDNDDDEDDVAALERKMQAAGMPSNIWKHAQRELRYAVLEEIADGCMTVDQVEDSIFLIVFFFLNFLMQETKKDATSATWL